MPLFVGFCGIYLTSASPLACSRMLGKLPRLRKAPFWTAQIFAQFLSLLLLFQRFLNATSTQISMIFLLVMIVTDSQFGFRCLHSWEFALVNLTDTLLTNIDQGLLNGLLLIDLKKAFELVDHTTLLSKLKLYGCSESSLKWFWSYLTNRSQKTTFKRSMSDPLPMSLGVPQESILRPLFFLIFINDLPFYLSSVCNVSLTMFADDTTILTTGSSVQLVVRNLNQLATEVSTWANINRMALNATKTKSMLVSSPQKLNTLLSQSLNVAINDSEVQQVTKAKILVVTFNHTLSWEEHIETLCKKTQQLHHPATQN